MRWREIYLRVRSLGRRKTPFEVIAFDSWTRRPRRSFGFAAFICLLSLTMFQGLIRQTYASTVNYFYDNAGRLVAVLGATGTGSIYAYDGVGNLTSVSPVTGSAVSVFALSRNYGPVGTSVTIYGDGFSTTPSQNTVQFNTTTAVVSTSTLTTIVTTVPQGATTGYVKVTVNGVTAGNQPIFQVQ